MANFKEVVSSDDFKEVVKTSLKLNEENRKEILSDYSNHYKCIDTREETIEILTELSYEVLFQDFWEEFMFEEFQGREEEMFEDVYYWNGYVNFIYSFVEQIFDELNENKFMEEVETVIEKFKLDYSIDDLLEWDTDYNQWRFEASIEIDEETEEGIGCEMYFRDGKTSYSFSVNDGCFIQDCVEVDTFEELIEKINKKNLV